MSEEARLAALLLAVDPAGLGGAVLRGPPDAAREAWLAALRGGLPAGTPWRRLPLGLPDSRLLGGLDLAATLAAGRPVAERGVLAEADGGIVLAAMAERIERGTAAKLAAVLDAREVAVQRDGLAARLPARIALVALDEGITAEEAVPAPLAARLAFHLTPPAPSPATRGRAGVGVRGSGSASSQPPHPDPPPLAVEGEITAARALLPRIVTDDALTEALCAAALSLGIHDPRAPIFALRAARAAAALAGRGAVTQEDAALAARLVLASRATALPAEEEEDAPPDQPPPPPDPQDNADQAPDRGPDPRELQEMLVAAARAALPAGLLEALQLREAARRNAAEGESGMRRAAARGRPIGTRNGALRDGARLALVETLRAAAPWQAVRRRESPRGPPIRVRREDIRLRRFRHQAGTTAIFVVDASGSSALHRLGEAKGAVELLLADCYVRRDQVAVVAFRGQGAQVLLPATPSLVRAKRSLAGLPGGGPTPLAAGLDSARGLAEEARRRGRTPLIVLLTDGRANIARDGAQGRPVAEQDALAAAQPFRLGAVASLLVDTAPRPHPFAKQLAAAMGARYLPLPAADAQRLSGAVAAARPG